MLEYLQTGHKCHQYILEENSATIFRFYCEEYGSMFLQDVVTLAIEYTVYPEGHNLGALAQQ
jgi:hypothetical protein